MSTKYRTSNNIYIYIQLSPFRENELLMKTFHETYHISGLVEKHWIFYKMLTTTDQCCNQALGVSIVLQLCFVLFVETKNNWCRNNRQFGNAIGFPVV